MVLVVIPYKPRNQFHDYHASTKRFAVSVCHRRAGKSVARLNKVIKAAILNDRRHPAPRYGYLAPYLNQSRRIAWQYLKYYCGPFLASGRAKANESNLTITFAHNGATIELYGADNADAMRGGYFDGIVPDEAQDITRSVLSQIIMPCLSDYKGWLDCAGTPKGWQNLLGELVKIAKADPDNWFLQILRASESGILDEQELATQRRLMTPSEYNAEFECDFDAAITGAVYGQQIAEADKGGRIIPNLPVADAPVHTAWDLGYDDATAIWWWQLVGGEIRWLDYYENSGQPISHYCAVVLERAKRYPQVGKHYVPHDAANELLAAGGRSIVQQAYTYGVQMYVVPATSQQNGIEALRKTLEISWFDSGRCDDTKYPSDGGYSGLDALRQYQFEFDQDKKVYRSKPRHDWCLAGETEILTPCGWREIKSLTVHDQVLTPLGARNILRSGIVRWTLEWITIKGIVCTPEHRFFTSRGLIQAGDLSGRDRLWTQDSLGLKFLAFTSWAFRSGLKAAIILATPQEMAAGDVQCSFIGWSIRLFMAKFHTATKSIIWTKILSTIIQTICKPFLSLCTAASTNLSRDMPVPAVSAAVRSSAIKSSELDAAKNVDASTTPESKEGVARPAYNISVAIDECYFVRGSDGKAYLVSNSSHASDAAEIVGQVWREQQKEIAPPKPKYLGDLTAEDIFWAERSGGNGPRI